MRPIVHLFVGLHKTGSTAIRFMLDVHRDVLPHHGFHLPRAAWTRYIDQFWNGGHNNVPWEICGHHPVLPQYGSVSDLVAEIGSLPDRQHIVFSEDLDYAQTGHVRALRKAFADFDVRVVVFLRNQIDWLNSLCAEEQKWYGAPGTADWYREHVASDQRLDYAALCARWAEEFGIITIRCYEAVGPRVFDAFLESCRAPEGLRATLAARSLPVINASHDALPLSLIRQASAFARANGVSPDYFNAVISPAILTASKRVLGSTKQCASIPADAASTLACFMRETNRRLASAFDIVLGPEYLQPDLGVAAHSDAVQPPEETAATLMAAICFDVGIRAGAHIRRLGGVSQQAHELAERYYPWRTPPADDASSSFDELLAAALATDHSALYLERRGDRGTAYRQADGALVELRQFSQEEWHELFLTIQFRAGLNTTSWNNLREGPLVFPRNGPSMQLWARHVPTTDGDVIVIEPIAA